MGMDHLKNVLFWKPLIPTTQNTADTNGGNVMTPGSLLLVVAIGALVYFMMQKGGGCCGGGGHDESHGSHKKELGDHNQGHDKEQPRGGCCG